MGIISKRIAIDLGTAFSVVADDGKEDFWRVASSIARDPQTRQLVAFGNPAKQMIGRTHEGLEVIRPLKDGVIADHDATNTYINHLLDLALEKHKAIQFEIFLCVPWGATPVELQSYTYGLQRKRSRFHLVREPFAAALGCGQDILESKVCTIVDMGGGTTEVATICGGLMLHATTLRAAGNFCDHTLVECIKSQKNFEVGLGTAEKLKMLYGSVWPQDQEYEIEVKGHDRQSQRPEVIVINTEQLRNYLELYASQVEELIRGHLSKGTREAKKQAEREGIYLAGGTSLIRGWSERLETRLGIPIKLADEPTHCVIRGMKEIIQDPKRYEPIIQISEKVQAS